ncbi:PIN domain-containing protein, partial [Streptomyces pratensis]|uniref:PIN domain-containing protein n=1 Tax=Streptomyces pratensis TaxID=1169025 RepID=UPI003624D977
MIILDTCVIFSMPLDGVEAHLLRAIKEAGRDRVAVPWMVLEERAAQLALEYSEAHEHASAALEVLRRKAPGDVPLLGGPDPESVRVHWRERLTELLEVLPTSEAALRQGMYREANILPPANSIPHPTKENRVLKLGARDVAIWLSAVEYARAHPEEPVYFVSSNTRDFGKGSTYPPPMDSDVEGLGDRFKHLTSLADLLKVIAPPVTVTPERVEKFLPAYTEHVRDAALARWGMPNHSAYVDRSHNEVMARWGAPARSITISGFPALVQASGEVSEVECWLSPRKDLQVRALDIHQVQGYHLGDQQWCTATVRWEFVGLALVAGAMSRVCCTWVTSIVMPLAEDAPSPRIVATRTCPADHGSGLSGMMPG